MEVCRQLDTPLLKSTEAHFTWLPRPVLHQCFSTPDLMLQAATPFRGLSFTITLNYAANKDREASLSEPTKDTTDGEAVLWNFKSSHCVCTKKSEKVTKCCNLLPTETNISDVKAIIAVIVEILGMNCSIPHNLRREASAPDLTSGKCWCTLADYYYLLS